MQPTVNALTQDLTLEPIVEIEEVQNYIHVLIYLRELADMDLTVATTERRDLGPAASLRVVPHPCLGLLQVGLPPGLGKRELQVHDICGRLVTRAVVPARSPRASLNLGGLQPGVYCVSAAGAGTVPVVVVR